VFFVYNAAMKLIRALCLSAVMYAPAAPLSAQDWEGVPIPVDPGPGKAWELQPAVSDDFNYTAGADDKGAAFKKRWKPSFHNAWKGPGLTEWNPANVTVADGHLQMHASRVPGGEKLHLGCITAHERVSYPAYVEARAKVMNSTLASDVWLLSPDDTQEIDILEAYGTSHAEGAHDQKDQTWFAERLHLSHHVFIREPFQDYQPKDAGSWYHEPGRLWRDEFIRIGVYWRDPWHLEYYLNGELVRTASGEDIIDPLGFTKGTGLNKEMDLIINVEDQKWRSDQGLTPTDAELENAQDHTFRIDWVRVYNLVNAG